MYLDIDGQLDHYSGRLFSMECQAVIGSGDALDATFYAVAPIDEGSKYSVLYTVAFEGGGGGTLGDVSSWSVPCAAGDPELTLTTDATTCDSIFPGRSIATFSIRVSDLNNDGVPACRDPAEFPTADTWPGIAHTRGGRRDHGPDADGHLPGRGLRLCIDVAAGKLTGAGAGTAGPTPAEAGRCTARFAQPDGRRARARHLRAR